MKWTIGKTLLLAGALTVSAAASAFYDPTIAISHALNSPTLTVRYSGVTVASVELRVNGVSVGTRSVSGTNSAGETNFDVDLSTLKDGDNQIEVRLFDKAGKIVGVKKSLITTEDGLRGPVFLSTPKVGTTVAGPVEIKVGFGKEMRNVYVSFFIDNQFRSMVNVAPYNYVWDTSRESNGWHELEAWVVDDSSTTFKTRKVRIFVNNISGRTERKTVPTEVKPTETKDPLDLTTIPNTVGSNTTGKTAQTKTNNLTGNSSAAGHKASTKEPSTGGILLPSYSKARMGQTSGLKSVGSQNSVVAGQKLMTPSGRSVVATNTKVTTKTSQVTAPVKATTMVSITKGQRLPNLPTYTILLNSKYVEFDVSPRVEDGIPLTPFRHLFEQAGGEVNWQHVAKTIDATGEGHSIYIKIGSRQAKVNSLPVELEIAPFIEKGRTVVPLSFIRDSLSVEVEYDPTTGHVLITSKK